MEAFQNALLKVGMWATKNKYLSAIRNAFTDFMPFIIAGAIATLWCHVIVNADTGLGAFFSPIMGLSFLNPTFNAINFCTMGCMSLFIAFLIGGEIAQSNSHNRSVGGVIAVAALFSVTNTDFSALSESGEVLASVSGIFSNELGSNGLFTAIIIAILANEIFNFFTKLDAIRIKMPDEVPPNVSRSFEVLVPVFLTVLVTGLISFACQSLTGSYLNDIVAKTLQAPLLKVGGSLPGIIIFVLCSTLFWSMGLHGDNITGGIVQPILFTLIAENEAAVVAGNAALNIINWSFFRVFFATGGTGMVLGLTLAFLIAGKRSDNKSISKIALIPNLFNIGEVNMFGIPVVMNPILLIPFILTPIITIIVGYVLTVIGLCPVMYINAPWTSPLFLYGFIASGGNIMGGISQLIAVAVSVVIYIPFVRMYEKQQNALDANNEENK